MDTLSVVKEQAEEIINKMVDASEIVVRTEEGMYYVEIKTEEEAPMIIGRHGETIRSLQRILEVILFKKTGENIRVLVNVNDYREKQQERLEHIASEAAMKTQNTLSPTYLRGFSSYERKIMHEYITHNYSDLSSYSVGEGRERRLVINTQTGAHTEE